MTYSIEVDGDVFKTLERRGRGFGDTANAVLRRTLGLDGRANGKVIGGRSPAGRDTTQRDYTDPIVQSLAALGGRATVPEILAQIERRMSRRFTEGDLEPVSTGGIRWEVTARWEVYRMYKDGLLTRPMRGTYQLAS